MHSHLWIILSKEVFPAQPREIPRGKELILGAGWEGLISVYRSCAITAVDGEKHFQKLCQCCKTFLKIALMVKTFLKIAPILKFAPMVKNIGEKHC